VTFGLHVTNHRLDGGSASQFALDGAEDTTLLTRDEGAARVLRVMTAVSLVDIGALDLAAGEFLGVCSSADLILCDATMSDWVRLGHRD
jgi:hypothetical protein